MARMTAVEKLDRIIDIAEDLKDGVDVEDITPEDLETVTARLDDIQVAMEALDDRFFQGDDE